MNAWLATKDATKVAEIVTRIEARAPERIEHAGGDRHFAVWLLLADRQIGARLSGLTHRDMPDWTWRDAYDSDDSPATAVSDALDYWRESGDLPEAL